MTKRFLHIDVLDSTGSLYTGEIEQPERRTLRRPSSPEATFAKVMSGGKDCAADCECADCSEGILEKRDIK